jgi:hypothetical protein
MRLNVDHKLFYILRACIYNEGFYNVNYYGLQEKYKIGGFA